MSATGQIISSSVPSWTTTTLTSSQMRAPVGWPTAPTGCSALHGADAAKPFAKSHGLRRSLATAWTSRKVKSMPTPYPHTVASASAGAMLAPPAPRATTISMVQVARCRRVGQCAASVDDSIGRFHEKERRFTGWVVAQLAGVGSVVTADTEHAANREPCATAADSHGRRGLQCEYEFGHGFPHQGGCGGQCALNDSPTHYSRVHFPKRGAYTHLIPIPSLTNA